MRSIVPSAAIAESHVALLSSLRAQGFAVERALLALVDALVARSAAVLVAITVIFVLRHG